MYAQKRSIKLLIESKPSANLRTITKSTQAEITSYILIHLFISGLHLSDGASLNHGALDLVDHEKSMTSIQVAVSKKRMKMNCIEVPARLVLYFLSWSGFLVSFMMRNDINFALVVMVRTNNGTILNANSSANVTQPQNLVS